MYQQNSTQIRQVQSTRVIQYCDCIQYALSVKKRKIRQMVVWGVVALFSILLLDLLNLSIKYESFSKNLLFVLIIKLSLLVGFLFLWYSKRYQKMTQNHRKALLFTYCLTLTITIIEEMILKNINRAVPNVVVIGIIQICIIVVLIWQIIDQNKLSVVITLVLTAYFLGRFFNYDNIPVQEIIFLICQFLILMIFLMSSIYFDTPLQHIKIEGCHFQMSPQLIIHNQDSNFIQQGQKSKGENYNESILNDETQNGHMNSHMRQNNNNTYNQGSHQYIIHNNDYNGIRDGIDTKHKGLSFSFDIASRDPMTPNQLPVQNHQAPQAHPHLSKSPLNVSLQCDRESELGQKSTNNSQKMQNIRSNLENSQGQLVQIPTMQRGASFLNESGNYLKASVQNSDSHQYNNLYNDCAHQNKFQLKAHPVGPVSNQPPPISMGSPQSNTILWDNTNYHQMQKTNGSQQQVESYKNISLAQIDMTNSKKMLNGKSVNSETVNLVNFYNMFFNILPEGIAIIPLINFPEKLEGCQINQTLSSLLECDNKEQCIQMLTELKNSKLEEQLAQLGSNFNASNLNGSTININSHSDFMTNMKSDSVISNMSSVNQPSEWMKKKKTNQIVSTQSIKEEVPVIFQDTISYDETKENYITEKTRRITFIVDINNLKKNKHLESHSDIVQAERKFSVNDNQRNNRFYSSTASSEASKNFQNSLDQNVKGMPLLKPSNNQVQLNSSTKLTVMKEIEHIRKQIQNLKFFDSYEMIGVHVRMVSKCKLENEKTKYFEIIFIPCIVKSEITVVLVVKDITHFNEIEVLKNVNENKSQMLSQVAHEIRTPLNCVISMLEITKDMAEKQICENYLGPALTSARLLNNLIQDLLDMAQVKAGCFQLKSTKFNIRNLIEEVRQLMKIQMQSSNIQMQVQVNDNVPLNIYSDPFRIRQILINLIGNALKFTQKGFITVNVERYVHQNIDSIIRIAVQDTGIGIKPKQKQKLFQAFGKLDDDNQESLNPKGVGLGLMISNELAKKLSTPVFTNQGLEVASVYGQGSEFSFYIIDNVQLQASVLHISQKTIQLHDNKTDRSALSKKKVNTSSLHRIDEDEREIKSQNEIVQEQLGIGLSILKQRAVSHQNPIAGNGIYTSPHYIPSNNAVSISNNHNAIYLQQPGSSISTQHYELYPIMQGNAAYQDKHYSPATQKEHHSYNGSSISVNNGTYTQQNNTTTHNQTHKVNCSINSFDHNIEDEESIAKPVHAQKYKKQEGNNNIAPHLNQTTLQDSYSSIQTDGMNQEQSYQMTDTVNQHEARKQLQLQLQQQQQSGQQGQHQNPSQYKQAYQFYSLQNLNQQQPLPQSPIPQSPSKYTTISTPNQSKRTSLQKNIFMKQIEEMEHQFGYVANPLLETKEIGSTNTQNDEQFIITSKTEKACACVNILIVDDNTFNIYSLKQLIKALKQYDCDTSLSGELAIELIEEKLLKNKCCPHYKIIFMDIDMPQQSGLETTASIRARFFNYKETKIIGCSGYSNTPQEYQECLDAGMNDYLAKPIDRNHLKQIIETYM